MTLTGFTGFLARNSETTKYVIASSPTLALKAPPYPLRFAFMTLLQRTPSRILNVKLKTRFELWGPLQCSASPTVHPAASIGVIEFWFSSRQADATGELAAELGWHGVHEGVVSEAQLSPFGLE